MGNWSYFVNILIVAKVLSADPCIVHLETNDTTILTTNKPTDVAAISCHSFTPFKWYRYTGTDDGLLTHVCPKGLQCGSHSQIWINGSYPTVDEGERPTEVCIHTETSCCSLTNTIRMKNCSDFMVYFFVPTPPCVNFCFYSPSSVDQMKDGGNGEGVGGEDNTKPPSKWVLSVTVGASVLVLTILAIIIAYKVKHGSRIEAYTEEESYGKLRNPDSVQNKKFTRFGDIERSKHMTKL